MDSVLQLSPRERAEVFQGTTQQTGFDAVIVEKDFWVCWTLKELFRLPDIGEHLIFLVETFVEKDRFKGTATTRPTGCGSDRPGAGAGRIEARSRPSRRAAA